jgi:hypothetical protein
VNTTHGGNEKFSFLNLGNDVKIFILKTKKNWGQITHSICKKDNFIKLNKLTKKSEVVSFTLNLSIKASFNLTQTLPLAGYT